MTRPDPLLEQDILIGQYTLGLLSAQDSHRLQRLLNSDPAAARTALHWEEAFLPLVDALPVSTPPQSILEQVLEALDLPMPSESELASPDVEAIKPMHTPAIPVSSTAEPVNPVSPVQDVVKPQSPIASAPDITRRPGTNAPDRHSRQATPAAGTTAVKKPAVPTQRPAVHQPVQTRESAIPAPDPAMKKAAGKRRFKALWMGGTMMSVMLVVFLILTFVPREPAQPPVVIVEVAPSKGAILQAPGQSSTPGWVVTIDQENNVTLTPQVPTELPENASVQLWTYNSARPQPRSLGLIDPNQPVAIPAAIMGEIGTDQFFEMTLEPEGGSASAEPTGPILFIGRVVTFSQ